MCEGFLSGCGQKLHPLNIVLVKILQYCITSCLRTRKRERERERERELTLHDTVLCSCATGLKEWAKALVVAERLTEPYKYVSQMCIHSYIPSFYLMPTLFLGGTCLSTMWYVVSITLPSASYAD